MENKAGGTYHNDEGRKNHVNMTSRILEGIIDVKLEKTATMARKEERPMAIFKYRSQVRLCMP